MHCGCTCLAAYNHLWQCTDFISATLMMKMVICHAVQLYAGLYYSISLNVCTLIRVKASNATWINSSTVIFLLYFPPSSKQRSWWLIHADKALFTLISSVFLLFDGVVCCTGCLFHSLYVLNCMWVLITEPDHTLGKGSTGVGEGVCRGAFLFPLLFRPCLPYFIFP